MLGEQVRYEASNLQEAQDSQAEAPGPLNAPLSHAVQVLVPPKLYVPLGQSWQGWPRSAYLPGLHAVHSEAPKAE